MKICIGNDHHGVNVKKEIISYLISKNIEYIDCGTTNEENVDYIDSAIKVCELIKNKTCDLGILICGTGIGMSIAANKIKGIYCAKVNNIREAKLCKEHNNANIISLGEDIDNVDQIVESFIFTTPLEEERHQRRINKIISLENN